MTGQGKHILIADDEEKWRRHIRRHLERSQYHVVEVENGEDLLAELERNRYDVVVTDGQLGTGIDGVDVLRRIKHDRRFGNIPVIVHSAISGVLKHSVRLNGGMCADKADFPHALDDAIRGCKLPGE